MSDHMTVVAIDMGGTKTAVATFDDQGRLIARSVVPTVAEQPTTTIAGLLGRAAALDGFADARAVGMALPAIVDPDGRVAWAAASVERWHGVDLVASLRTAFDLPAVALFDGYAATEGEAIFGAGRGFDSVVTLIIGTGLGAGVWLDGRIVEGRTGVAGAVGWSRWPMPDGSISPPVESVASGTGILAEARRRGRPADYTDTRAVFARAEAGDEAARAAIALAVTAAGTVAAHVIDLLAPQLLVWSGGVGSRADFAERATAVAQQSCQPYAATRTQFRRSSLGAESSLAGAAARALSIAKGAVPR
jgi:glucokinase